MTRGGLRQIVDCFAYGPEIAAHLRGRLIFGIKTLEVLRSNSHHQRLCVLYDVCFGGSQDFGSTEICIASNFRNGDTRPIREGIPELGENFLLAFRVSRPGGEKLVVRWVPGGRSRRTRIPGFLGVFCGFLNNLQVQLNSLGRICACCWLSSNPFLCERRLVKSGFRLCFAPIKTVMTARIVQNDEECSAQSQQDEDQNQRLLHNCSQVDTMRTPAWESSS